ncbi:MAG: F0F1 ATP synthase subunit A [Oscillospiraceae bacterium]|nr:F0F1 ATP synthase subunit A [Oscillospiraceae bacterium]MBR3921348.1 F0F1 ATP synthase subunit A [Oscillospiraceae bacterium]
MGIAQSGDFGGVSGPGVLFSFELPLIGTINITESVVIGFVLVVLISLFVIWLTHGMGKIPTKRQVVAEWIVETVNKLVKDNMGPSHLVYAPYIATIFVFSITGSLVSLFGLRSMTADASVTISWALICLVMITYTKLKYSGIGGYLKGFTEPIFVLTPMNIFSEVMTPVSMGLRHFGNVAGGMVITSLIYWALANLSAKLHLYFSMGELKIGVLQVGIPAVLSVYFDLFSGFMQAFIFVMLTMANVGNCIPDDKK